nr:protein kinase [Angustibacter aerolatus]
MADPLVGRVLDGRYLVRSRIARGGMATVYLAVDQRLDREVALKVMHAGLGDDEEFVRRFTQEARSAARLSHPGVVQVYDQGEHDGVVFLAMEHVRGRTLRDVMDERGPLSPREALDVLEPGARRARRGARRRHRAPRREARERAGRRRRPHQGRRLRARPGRRQRHHQPDRAAHRHRRLPRTRAGRARTGRRPQRRVRHRRAAVRACSPPPSRSAARPPCRSRSSTSPARCRRPPRGRRRCPPRWTTWWPPPPPATPPTGRRTPASC